MALMPQPSDDARAAPVSKPFVAWTLSDAHAALAWLIERRVGTSGFDVNERFAVMHDHFQRGEGWLGPNGDGDVTLQGTILDAVERQFTPVDTIDEVLENVANGLLRRRPALSFEPLDPAEPETDAAEAQQAESQRVAQAIERWAKRVGLWRKLRAAVRRSRWATWGTLRAWVPSESRVVVVDPAATDEDPTTVRVLPSNLSLEDALAQIQITDPSPRQAAVYTDPETQERLGIFAYRIGDREYVELVWVDVTGETVFRVLGDGTTEATEAVDLGGALPLVHLDGDLLITDPVRRQQHRQNFFESMKVRSGETAGFRERYLLNTEPVGMVSDTAPNDPNNLVKTIEVDGVTKYVVAMPLTLGAGTTAEVRGIVVKNPDGSEAIKDPTVVFADPVDPEGLLKLARDARATILRQCRQGHLEMDADGDASGWARVQARAIYQADLEGHAPVVETALVELVAVVLHLAGQMTAPGELGDFLTRYRPSAMVKVTTGPVSPEEETAIIARLAAGACSLEKALSLLQVDDVAAEIERIRSQPESRRKTLQEQATLMQAFTAAGCSLLLAAQLAGLEDAQVTLIRRDVAMQDEDPEDDDPEAADDEPPGRRDPNAEREAP